MVPYNYRRARMQPRRSARRRVSHVTLNGVLLPSLTTGQYLGQDLLSGFAGLSSDQGFTVVRSTITLVPNIAPALNDFVGVGVAKCRNTDFGANVVNGLNTSTTTYGQWSYLNMFIMNGGLTRGGGNVITLSTRRRVTVREDDDGFGLFLTSGFVAAVQFRVFARTTFLLP